MGEFSPPPPLFLSPLLSVLFSYPSNIEIIFDFSDIITKIHPPFQNPGSALGYYKTLVSRERVASFLDFLPVDLEITNTVIVFSIAVQIVDTEISQQCCKSNRNLLKIPTGRRLTSWLLTKRGGVEPGTTKHRFIW